MFTPFTPYTYLFLSFYLMFLSFLFTISNFYVFWIFIEFMILIFIGMSYSVFVNSYSQLISYFLIQTLSSLLLLVSYVYSISFLFTISVLLNMSIFPFMFWFINVILRFPPSIMFISITLHKLPVIILINTFTLNLSYPLLLFSIFSTILFSGLIILMSNDLRIFLILSSIGNGSWFILSQYTSITCFTLYFLFYSLSLYFILDMFNNLSNLSYSSPNSAYPLSFWLLSISGLPIFPLFFLNVYIIYGLIASSLSHYSLILILLSVAVSLSGYVRILFNYFIFCYSTLASTSINY